MKTLLSMLVAGVACVCFSPPSVAVQGEADRTSPPAPARSVKVVQRPKQVTEGQRAEITVKVAAPGQAKTVRIETRGEDIFGNPEWTTLKRALVRGRAKVRLAVTVTGVNTQVFRAVAVYKDKKSAASKPFPVIVWRWMGLHEFNSYYSTPGVYDSEYLAFPMNGHQYIGWQTYGSYGAWETRYTLGRHCRRMQGVFGVHDQSADGSTAKITVLADDQPLFESNALSPGTVQVVSRAMPRAYRISILAQTTSEDPSNYAYPAIGTPQFLCTGL
ncbi:MAG: hypothetical protein Q8O61_16850 [Nocardioides sp.]|nr:hypothetical protein [Nocardioides sp.]